MTFADAIFTRILKGYVETVFFLPGGGSMYLVDALGRSGLTYITTLHEQGAGYAAMGYAMARGGLGVCLTTSGPGATNAITACAACWTDSAPVLFISGQAKSSTLIGDSGLRTRGMQEIDIIPMVAPITKKAIRANGMMLSDVRSLSELCLEGRRGPCWIDVP